MTLPLATCVLFTNQDSVTSVDTHALVVSRKNNKVLWGLPGGKVDPGETVIEAAVREIKEEIGVDIDPNLLRLIYQCECSGDVTYRVATYLYLGLSPKISELVLEEGLNAQYTPISNLLDVNFSPFAVYNRGVVEALQHANISAI